MNFEEALELATHGDILIQNEFINSPAALCILCSRDQRRIDAGYLIRDLAKHKQGEELELLYLNIMEHEKHILPITAKAFWFAHEAFIKRWGVKEKENDLKHSSMNIEKQSYVSFPIIFSVHVPRA